MAWIVRTEKWLFICSANIIRSSAAEYLARKSGMLARSCGSGGRNGEHFVVTPMTREIVEWADVIVCMKESHRLALSGFVLQEDAAAGSVPISIAEKKIFVWGVDDIGYRPYQPELLQILEAKLLESAQQYDMWREENAGRIFDGAAP